MQSLSEKDRQYIWHPFTSFLGAPPTIPIVKGEGIYLVDESGNRYLDAISSWWVNLHGHANPYIAGRIYQQALELEQVIFAGFTHRPAVELAERLIGILPGNFSKIFYSDNGSTATEVALKMAIQFWWNQGETGRNTILAFRNSYHGDTFGAMSVSDRSVFTMAFREKLFDVEFIEEPTADNIDEIKYNITGKGEQVAAFIYEPLVQGAGGMKIHEPGFLNEVIASCRKQGVVCIADEVMTGFGRTGKLFASEYMSEKPDIACLSKGLTGGTMALGVTAANQRIVDSFTTSDQQKTFFHGHSFTANPLACTAALASLDLLQKPECLQQIADITASNSRFAVQLKLYPNIRNLRCLGTILAFEYNTGKDEYLNEASRLITAFMLQHNVYLRPLGNTVYIMPPYCITREELDKIYSTIIEFLVSE